MDILVWQCLLHSGRLENGGNPYVTYPNHPGTYDNIIAANAGRVLKSKREAVHKAWLDNHLMEKAVQQVTKISS
eukprot:13984394-Ditylum_brightwellii.AAC.1